MGTRPIRSLVTERSGKSQIDQYFWENLTRVVGSGMGGILQEQQSQQQPTATSSSQAGHRDVYSDWEIASLMGYSQVYTESGIPRIWGKFQISK